MGQLIIKRDIVGNGPERSPCSKSKGACEIEVLKGKYNFICLAWWHESQENQVFLLYTNGFFLYGLQANMRSVT